MVGVQSMRICQPSKKKIVVVVMVVSGWGRGGGCLPSLIGPHISVASTCSWSTYSAGMSQALCFMAEYTTIL